MEMPVKPHPRFAFARLRALFTDPPRRRRGGLKRAAGRWSALVLSAWTAASCGRAPTADAEPAGTPPPEPPPAPQRRVLKTTIPGRWYPDDAAALGAQMRALLEAAPATDAPPDVIALILPHAGFQFSGSTAAAGLKAAVGRQYARIVVLGPSHAVAMPDLLSVPRATHVATPLGEIPLDEEFIGRMLEAPFVREIPEANTREHSTQMALPPLQAARGGFRLVPVVVGQCSEDTRLKAAALLRRLMDDDTLVVVSSDFTHYGPNYNYLPFRDDIPARLEQLDRGAFEAIQSLDFRRFLDYCRTTGATICGREPIAILLAMLAPGTRAAQVAYATSGGITGDYSNSVSYLAVAFRGRWEPAAATASSAATEFGPDARRALLALARAALLDHLRHDRVPQPADLGLPPDAAMQKPRGVFVTLRRAGRLRGCIGSIFPHQPLDRAVIANAIHAGVDDRRFTPVTADECPSLTIEISVLTPPAPVAGPEAIRVGTDGVVLSKQGRSAVFLPQVATEQGWNREQMLTELARKAGLPPDAWRQGAEFLVFQAEVFGEEER